MRGVVRPPPRQGSLNNDAANDRSPKREVLKLRFFRRKAENTSPKR